jgi:hypothetical protein
MFRKADVVTYSGPDFLGRDTMKTSLIILTTLAAMTGGAAGLSAKKEPTPVRAVGEPVNCVSLSRIRSTDVIDDSTIDFKMAGGKTYRNSLPHSCPGLKFEDRFSYKTSINQLCSVDIIRVLNDHGGHLSEGAGCGLGKFQPVEKINATN